MKRSSFKETIALILIGLCFFATFKFITWAVNSTAMPIEHVKFTTGLGA